MTRLLTVAALLALALTAAVPVAQAKGGDNSGPGSAHSGRDDDAEDRADEEADAAEDRADEEADAAEDRADDEADAAEDRAEDRDDSGHGSDDDGTADQGPGDAPRSSPAAGGTGAGAGPVASSAEVSMGDKSFQPATVTVGAGGTVTWRNTSDREHTVTADDQTFDSDVLGGGQTFRRRFDRAGTFAYRCLIHSDMTGSVVVTGGGASDGAGSSGSPALSSAAPAPAPAAAPAPRAQRPVAAGAAGGSPTVTAVDFAFEPASLTVPPGTEVRFVNDGQALHTATGDAFDSGSLRSGQSFSHTFADAGTFAYSCAFHPDMTGEVRVVEGAAPAAADPPPAAESPPSAESPTSADPAPAPALASTGPDPVRLGLGSLSAAVAVAAGVRLLRRRRRVPA